MQYQTWCTNSQTAWWAHSTDWQCTQQVAAEQENYFFPLCQQAAFEVFNTFCFLRANLMSAPSSKIKPNPVSKL